MITIILLITIIFSTNYAIVTKEWERWYKSSSKGEFLSPPSKWSPMTNEFERSPPSRRPTLRCCPSWPGTPSPENIQLSLFETGYSLQHTLNLRHHEMTQSLWWVAPVGVLPSPSWTKTDRKSGGAEFNWPRLLLGTSKIMHKTILFPQELYHITHYKIYSK